MSSWNSEYETESDDSSGDENYEFTAPTDIDLPNFLNTDYKWNECISQTESLQQYCSLIGKITNLSIHKEIKREIMLIITSDIIIKHKKFSPHWRLLQQHAFFQDINIL